MSFSKSLDCEYKQLQLLNFKPKMSVLFKKSYWKFLIKSSNQHGIHSPFVYFLITECFYKKRKNKNNYKKNGGFPKLIKNRHLQVLDDFINYFNVSKYTLICNDKHQIEKLDNLNGCMTTDKIEKTDLVYVSAINANSNNCIDVLKKQKNNSVLVVEAPYQFPNKWRELKSNATSNIIVDTYFWGFIFKREQQRPEEFKIRL